MTAPKSLRQEGARLWNKQNRQKNLKSVQVIDFVEFLKNNINSRTWTGDGPGKVLCKIDIEGNSFPALEII